MRGQNTVYCRLTGTPELERRLRLLAERVRKKVVSAALRKAAKPIIEAAKRNAKTTSAAMGERTGGLSASIGSVVRNYAKKVICVIGPMRDRTYSRLGKREVPANIAHLVEFGHRILSRGSSRGGSLTVYKAYHSRNSKSRVVQRNLRTYLTNYLDRFGSGERTSHDKWSAVYRALHAHSMRFAKTGDMTSFLSGAIATGGMYQKTYRGKKSNAPSVLASGRVPGYPFLRPAWDSRRAAAQSVLEQELARGIEEAAK